MIATLLTKFKGYALAVAAFFFALFTARYYRTKAKRLDKQITQERHKARNLDRQYKAIMRHQAAQKQEIENATKDDSYLDYFDREP